MPPTPESLPASPASDGATELARLLRTEGRRESAVVQVAIWIATGIVEGDLRPGQEVNSVDLARRFAVSRTPVREALMLLESEGLVEIRARRRPRVTSFTAERIREIYFVRRHLLALVGELMAQRVTDHDIAVLRRRLAGMRRSVTAGDVAGYFWGHVDWQSQFLRIAGNDTLRGILDSLALRTLVLRYASLGVEGRPAASLALQERIFEALTQRDGPLTALLLVRSTEAAEAAIDVQALSEPWAPAATEVQVSTDIPVIAMDNRDIG
ncbi:GntR family transcriptional regulator [Pseudonocardia nematodicida]|uniref:GntR family transcriptional regulator n=1 Tax=Pseudonocardia nematodicida TaxID=1206997 RepID=A0ABV1KE11_9PSEU